jgi:hypothetical protein
MYLTDRLVRFTIGTDACHTELMYAMMDIDLIESDQLEFLTYAQEGGFCAVYHIYIANDEGESIEDNRKKAEEALANWEAGKSREKGRVTLWDRLASVPYALPALLRTQKYMEKCAGGCDELLPPRELQEGILSLSGVSYASDPASAAGDFLLAAVAAFQAVGIECEGALTLAADRLLAKVKKAEKAL